MGRSGGRLNRLTSSDVPVQITIANVASFIFSFLTAPVIARSVGADGRGETAAVVAAFLFVPILLGFGIPLEVRRRSTGCIDKQAVRSARDIVILMFAPAMCLSALLTVTVFSGTSDQVRLLAAIGIATAPISVSWSVDVGALVGAGRYRAVFLLRVAQPGLVLLLMVPAWLFGTLTPSTILVVYLVGNLSTAVLGRCLNRVSLRGARAERKKLAAAGFHYAGSAVAESASAKLDQIVVLPLIGAVETGYYALAVSISVLPIVVSHALAAKHFREMASSADEEGSNKIAREGLHECASLVAPLALLLAASGYWLVPVVFGSDFKPSTSVLLILVPGSFAMSLSYVSSLLLAARRRGGVMTVTQTVSLGLDMALLVPLASLFAANGAALASTISYLCLIGMQMFALRVGPRVLLPTSDGITSGLRSLTR